MADKEVKIKVTTEADASELKDLQTTLQDTQRAGEEAGSKITEEIENLQKEFQEATSEVEKLENELEEVELNGDDVQADIIADQLADARERADELETSLEEAYSAMEDLSNASEDLDPDTLSTMTENAEELAEGLGSANNNATELGDSLAMFEGTAMLDIAQQVGGFGGSMESMAQGLNSAQITIGHLATQTGIAEPQLRSMISYISNATFPQEEAMAYVQTLDQIGVSSSNFAKSATDMDRINDAFGIGYDKVINLTRGMSALGVDANNLSTSFNALAYTQSNVVGGVDTLTTVLGRQGSKFAELGLNIDQVALIMDKASHKWTTARSLNSGLSNALKDCNGDLRVLEQELGLQAGALDNASQYTSQYTGKLQEMANEEAEHKTWLEQIGALWEDFALQLSPVLTPLMSAVGILGSFGQLFVTANAIVSLAEAFGILKTTEEGIIAVQWAEGTAGWFSIGWIAVAILLGIALGLALIYLWNNSEQFRNAVIALGNGLKWLANLIVSNIMNAVNRFSQIIQGIPNSIKQCLDWANGLIMNHPIVQTIIWLGEQMSKGFSALGLNQHSPGDIYKALKLDLDAMDESTDEYGRILPDKFRIMGRDISDNFNSNLNNSEEYEFANNIIIAGTNNTEDTGKTEVNNIFNIDYLAKKEFAQDIIDIIQNEINWNNTTAGRIV